MRPSDAIFRSPPVSPWLEALRKELGGGGREAPPETLGAAAALTELRLVCEHSISGGGEPNRPNRVSLLEDVALALDALGPEAKTAAEPLLSDFRRHLTTLVSRLKTPKGARAVGLVTKSLLQRLCDREVVLAAWRDTAAAFRAEQLAAEECEICIRQLHGLAELRNRDWEAATYTITRLLSDDAYAIAQVLSTPIPTDADDEFAGTTEDHRVRLAEHVLTADALSSEIVVWVVFLDARFQENWMQLGPVQFFDGQYWAAKFDTSLDKLADKASEIPALPEMEDWQDAKIWFSYLPDGDKVYARIKFPQGVITHARERAREIALSILDLANPESQWVLLDGAVSWRKDGGWSGSMFADPRELAANSRSISPRFEGTSEALLTVDPRLLERLVEGSERARAAVTDARWVVSLRRLPSTEQRVALGTRVLERVLEQARADDETWAVAAKRYLLAPWLRHIFYEELFEAAAFALALMPYRHTSNEQVYRELHDAIMKPTQPGQREFQPRQLFRYRDRLLALQLPGSVEYRLVRDAKAQLEAAPIALAKIAKLKKRFDVLLARAERQRNAILHGGVTHAPVIASVDRFIDLLGAHSTREIILGVETADEPLSRLEKLRVELVELEAQLQVGQLPVDVFFPNDAPVA